jgi:Homeodomain-like domain
MPETAKGEEPEAQQRRLAVTLFRTGQKAVAIATQLQRSRRWVYYWVAYQRHHPHTHFRSVSSAPHHHPNQPPAPSSGRSCTCGRAYSRSATPACAMPRRGRARSAGN